MLFWCRASAHFFCVGEKPGFIEFAHQVDIDFGKRVNCTLQRIGYIGAFVGIHIMQGREVYFELILQIK